MTSKVDASFSKAKKWKTEAEHLRKILLECEVTEQLKWGKPCYTFDDKNIAIIQRMNDFLALLFFKGALLKDNENILEKQGPNSNSGYRICFTSVDDVRKLKKHVKAYIREAIEVEKAGLKVKKPASLKLPDELVSKMDEDPKLKAAFAALTPGRQRGYKIYFSSAKQSKTRDARIEKYRGKILAGKGFQD